MLRRCHQPPRLFFGLDRLFRVTGDDHRLGRCRLGGGFLDFGRCLLGAIGKGRVRGSGSAASGALSATAFRRLFGCGFHIGLLEARGTLALGLCLRLCFRLGLNGIAGLGFDRRGFFLGLPRLATAALLASSPRRARHRRWDRALPFPRPPAGPRNPRPRLSHAALPADRLQTNPIRPRHPAPRRLPGHPDRDGCGGRHGDRDGACAADRRRRPTQPYSARRPHRLRRQWCRYRGRRRPRKRAGRRLPDHRDRDRRGGGDGGGALRDWPSSRSPSVCVASAEAASVRDLLLDLVLVFFLLDEGFLFLDFIETGGVDDDRAWKARP